MLHAIGTLFLGLAIAIGGMGLTMSFGVMAFVGMPLLIIGLGVISAGTEELSRPAR